MTKFRKVKRNGKTYTVPIRESSGSDRFIQKSIKHPGRVREYIERTYGKEGFTEKGTIKPEYLVMAKKKAEENHNRSLVDAIDLAMRLRKDQGSDPATPYGVNKNEAEEDVHKLREEGEHARLIETNRKKKLYAPYEGALNHKATEQNKDTPHSSIATKNQKLTYTEAAKNMKEVPVDLRLSGDTRKGKIYAAVITGTDPKYGLKREFLNGDRTRVGKNDVVADYQVKLKPGTIIETSEGGSWKNSYGTYYIVTPKGAKPLKDNYNKAGTLYVKDIMKAREKAIPKENK